MADTNSMVSAGPREEILAPMMLATVAVLATAAVLEKSASRRLPRRRDMMGVRPRLRSHALRVKSRDYGSTTLTARY